MHPDIRHIKGMPTTGKCLKAARRAKGINQTELGVPSRMLGVLGFEVFPPINTRAREPGVLVTFGWADKQQEALDRKSAREAARINAMAAQQTARVRVHCAAKTRQGHPCRMKSEPGKRRCKFHGGKSTGPKTAEGKARIAEAQRKRWTQYRAAKDLSENSILSK